MNHMMETCPEYIGDLIKEAVVICSTYCLYSQIRPYSIWRYNIGCYGTLDDSPYLNNVV